MKTLQTILSGLLILIVLMSSISHSVSFHLCGGEIENMSIFGQAKSCVMHDNGCDDRANAHLPSFDHNGCCKDTSLIIDTDKYLSKAIEKVSIENLLNVSIAVVDMVQSISYTVEVYSHTSIYKPPIINRDITVLVQSFLI